MPEMINLKDLTYSTQEVLTIAELDDAAIEQARRDGWSLRATFEGERRTRNYSSDVTGKTLFGVFALPTDRILKEAIADRATAEKAKRDAEAKIYDMERKAKEAIDGMFQARSELQSLKDAMTKPAQVGEEKAP